MYAVNQRSLLVHESQYLFQAECARITRMSSMQTPSREFAVELCSAVPTFT